MIRHDQHTAPTILIIENDPSNRFLAERILSIYGYRYLSAANGKEALDLLDSTDVDCIITDLSMPVLDGLSVTSVLRQRPEYADIPIVALTAHAFGTQRQEALRVGCTDVIVKPYHPKQLVETIARYLNSNHA